MVITKAHVRERKHIKTMLIVVTRKIWQERNARTFRKNCSLVNSVVAAIRRDNEIWRLAGMRYLETQLGDPGGEISFPAFLFSSFPM